MVSPLQKKIGKNYLMPRGSVSINSNKKGTPHEVVKIRLEKVERADIKIDKLSD